MSLVNQDNPSQCLKTIKDVLGRFGIFWFVVGRCGSLWIVVDRFGFVVGRCGWLWVVLGRFGWFLVLVTTSDGVSLLMA